MNRILNFDEFLNESVRYINSDHKEYVEEWGLGSYKVPKDLKDLVGKRIKVIKKINYEFGDSPEHGTEGVIRHAYLSDGDLIYSIMSKDGENFEATPEEVKIID